MKKSVVLCFFVYAFMAVTAFAQDSKVVVIPLNTSKVPAKALPIAYGYVSGSASPFFYSNYGCVSVSSTATGDYTITLENNYTDRPVVVATSYNSSPKDEIVTWSYSQPNQIMVQVSDGSGTAAHSNFSFVVYGTLE